TLPPGFVITFPHQGTNDLADSDADPTNGMTPQTLFLSSGTTNLSLDMGIYAPVAVGDFVWVDTDGDGIQDGGETGVVGVAVVLFDSMTNVVATNVTDGAGGYLFTDLPPDSYSIDFDETSLPAGFVVTFANQGTNDAVDSDGDVTTPFLPSGTTNLTFDLGLYEPVEVGDLVWLDVDGDGLQDPAETSGVAGITVILYDNQTNAVATNITDGAGQYLFTNLPPGDYLVQFEPASLPPGARITLNDEGGNDAGDSDGDPATGFTPPTPFIVSGADDLTVDLGIFFPVTIGNFVWLDEDGDGIQDPGETNGVSGVDVVLFNDSNVPVVTNTTDANGMYLFTNLPPGSYYVDFDESTLSNLLITVRNAGGDDTLDSDGDPITGSTAPPPGTNLFFFSGATNLTLDLGVFAPITIGEQVWLDEDGDGIQDPLETNGIPGVSVTLFDGMTNSIGTVTTDADGEYVFTNLPPDTYFVQFDLGTLPTGLVATFDNEGGDDALDSDGDPMTGVTPPTPFLVSGTTNQTLDLGVYEPVQVGETFWVDEDGDGVQ
ncbi:MAG: SdrD B-like domain-containing protein, partial [Verrucomicrobiota bacterium]